MNGPSAGTRTDPRPAEPAPGGARGAATRLRADRGLALSCAAVVVVVVLANALYWTGAFDPNPLGQYSNLALHTRAGILPGQNNIDPNQGFVSQALGHLAAEDWLHGHVPWWNPFEGLGMPLGGEMQSAALFFPLVLLDAFSQGQIVFRIVLEAFCGLATLFLLRRLVRSQWAALAGAVAFALNGTFSWMFHAPANPVAFAPLVLLAVEQARAPAGRLRSGWPLLAVGLALSVYAGFPEVAFIDGLLALLWAVVRASEMSLEEVKGYAGRLAAGGAVGLLLAAPLLVAFATFAQGANLLDHSGGGLTRAWLDPSIALPPVVMPYIDGPVFSWLAYDHSGANVAVDFWGNVGGYAGISVVTLGFVAVTGRRERRLRLALAAWVVLSLGRTMGAPGLRQIVDAVPGVSQTAFYRYSAPSWTLALVVLAALAIDDLTARREKGRLAFGGALASLVVVVLALVALRYHAYVSGAPYHWVWFAVSVAVAVAVVAGCVAAGLLARPKVRATALAAIVMAESFCLFVLPQLSAPRSVVLDTAPVRYLQNHLGLYRFFTLGPLAPNYGSYYDLASLNINDEPMVASFYTYVERSLNQNVYPATFTGTVQQDPSGPNPTEELLKNLSGYEAAGVKFVIQPQNSPFLSVAGKRLPVVFSDRISRIVSLPDPQPFESTSGGGCTLTSVSLESAVADCSRPGLLVRREQFLAGWSATVNGHAARISRYGPLFQSVRLRAGRNLVRFGFSPPHAGAALAGFALGLLALLAAAAAALLPGRAPATGRHFRSRAAPSGARAVS